MFTTRKFSLIALTLLHAALFGARAEDWPHWRGPQRNGISAEKDWKAEWPDQGPPILWKAKVGLGYSSFVVADGRAFTVGHADEKDTVFCFYAATGKAIWKHSYPAELGDKYFQGGTTGTPTYADGRLYWLSRWGDLICFEAATGKIIWQKNIQKETGAPLPDWGFTGAPTVHENLLILNVGDAGTAVEKDTGKLVWSSKRSAGYSTPLPFQESGRTLVAIGSSGSYVAIDPKTGKDVWRIPWMTEYGVNAADPIITEQYVFLSTGYGKGAALFDRANLKAPPIWKSQVLRTQLSPAVLHNGFVYGPDGDTTERAKLKCIDLKTGQEKWSQSGFGSGGLIMADGRIIALSSQGELITAAASPDGFKPTARAQVLGGTSWTAPVLANGRVYCRNSRGDVVCVDLGGND